jgi:hypothetical protein
MPIVRRAADPEAGGNDHALCDDKPTGVGHVGIDGQRLVGDEM